MSDSHIYELEDIVWDDFSISDNHLVPHPEIEQNERKAVQTESCKKLKHAVGMTSITGNHGEKHDGVATEKNSFSSPNIKSEQVLANGSWSHNPDPFQTYDELMTNLSSEGPTTASCDYISNKNLFTIDPTAANNCTAAEKNISYSLSDAPQSESDLSFFYNGHENKETDDALFYEWPVIGNFEDVNHLLRTCDSTFGLGDLAKEDELCWFSSSTAINGSDTASKSEARSSYSDSNSLKNFSENSESPRPNYENRSVDAFNKRSAGASYISSTLASNTREQSYLSKASSINEMTTNFNKKDKEEPLKEVMMHRGNMEYQTQPVLSLHQFDSSEPPSNTQLSSRESSQKLFSINCRGLHKQNVDDFTYSDPISAQKEICNSGIEEESFNKNSQSDERSLEETSFYQLREVMEQLDLKTKLCIRDSLYRLARSAEQKHGVATTMNRVSKADKNSSEALIAETRCAGLIDIETDTNPIDRSIAHLLFHRPNDPSKNPPPQILNYGAEDMGDFKDANGKK